LIDYRIQHSGSLDTRSQAVARIADGTASQQNVGSNLRLLLNSIAICFRDIAL